MLNNLILSLGNGQELQIPECRQAINIDGKSRTERQMSVLSAGLAWETRILAATKKGKLGTAARGDMGVDALKMIAVKAAQGNYTPLYETLVLNSVKHVQPIRNTESFERARGFVCGLRDNLKNGGYTSAGKLTADAVALDECINLFRACDAAIEDRKAKDAERRAQLTGSRNQGDDTPLPSIMDDADVADVTDVATAEA